VTGPGHPVTGPAGAESRGLAARQLARMVEDAAVAIAVFDRDLRYLVASRRWRDDLGLGDRSLEGQSHYALFPDISPAWRAVHQRSLAGAVEHSEDDRFVTADGVARWLRWETRPWYDDDGAIGGITICGEDVSARHQVSDELRASEQRFRLMIEGVKDCAIFTLDPDGRVATWPSGAEQIFGHRAEEILGAGLAAFYTADDIARGVPARNLERAVAHGSCEEEGWRVRHNGSRFWASGGLSAIFEHGALRGFSKVVRDLTPRRRAQELLRSVLDGALDGIVGVDRHGTVLTFNQSAERMFGYAAREVLGGHVGVLVPAPGPPADATRARRAMLAAIVAGAGASRELQGRRKDGTTFPIELSLNVFQLDDEPHYTAVLRDLSDRRRLEDRLRQAQKMEAFGQLAGGVAHDFNNLLTVILGNVEVLASPGAPADMVGEAVADIRGAAERAVGLTRQLLAFSRQQVLAPQVVDLNEVLTRVEKLLRRVLGEHIATATSLAPDLVRIRVDPGQIEQVVLNLAVNARDAMPAGGRLLLSTATVDIAAGVDAERFACPPGRYARLRVTDTGMGMDAATRARLFEPFFTTKGPGTGTGLGLATVKGIVEQSGGFIAVDSQVGRGTAFDVLLPAIDARAPAEPAPAPGSARGHETILLVEDEAAVRRVARRIMEQHGYRVLEASDGEAARALFDQHQDAIALVVTDVVMPGQSGPELAAALRRRTERLKVLFMSGYTDDAMLRAGALGPDEAFLHKPLAPESFARKVRELLDG